MNVSRKINRINRVRLSVCCAILSSGIYLSPQVLAADASNILPPISSEATQLQSFASMDDAVLIQHYSIVGNTVLESSILEEIVRPYVNRSVTFEELSRLRDRLTLAYVERGYVSSGATIDYTALAANSLLINITEGTISELLIDTDGRLRENFVRKRLQSETPEVFNLFKMETRLQVLQQDGRILSLQSKLSPDAQKGESTLQVSVVEKKALTMSVELSNYESPNVGATRAMLSVAHQNISGFGDSGHLNVRKSEGLLAWQLGYSWPFGSRGANVFTRIQRSDSEVIEEPFDLLNITSEASTVTLGFEYPIYRSIQSQFNAFLSIDKRHSESFLLGMPFAFSEGVEDGEADITAVRFGQSFSQRTRQRAFALRSTFSFGVDALDATIGENNNPDGRFVTWKVQTQYAQRVGWLSSQVIARADLQLSNEPLLGLERFAIGGHTSVRGYRENTFSGDNGAFVSVQWNVPVYSRAAGTQSLVIAPFTSAGSVWDDANRDDKRSLVSAGLGVLWRSPRGMQFNLHWAHGFDEVGGQGDLQDDGIHVQARYEF